MGGSGAGDGEEGHPHHLGHKEDGPGGGRVCVGQLLKARGQGSHRIGHSCLALEPLPGSGPVPGWGPEGCYGGHHRSMGRVPYNPAGGTWAWATWAPKEQNLQEICTQNCNWFQTSRNVHRNHIITKARKENHQTQGTQGKDWHLLQVSSALCHQTTQKRPVIKWNCGTWQDTVLLVLWDSLSCIRLNCEMFTTL